MTQPEYKATWSYIEQAKHRLVYSLLRFKLPVASKFRDEKKGIAFDFKADDKNASERLLTGHEHGVITINIDETDDVIREMARKNMDEVYRTLLGHFRHEIGHYYWDRLIRDTNMLPSFRKLFGDESIDYSEALKKHYSQGPSPAWTEKFISAYAGAHPWEDWAETWAHYTHIVDTLETAYWYGMTLNPKSVDPTHEMGANVDIDPYETDDFEDIIKRWLPLSL